MSTTTASKQPSASIDLGETAKLTPAMRQYQHFKRRYPDCVLFFRMGDFYEMFYDDAKLAHRVLGVALTQRTQGVPMAGVPYHAVDNYMRRMIQAGHRVAVCDQVQDPREAKGVVERDVTRVITPGTLTDDAMMAESESNPLVAVMFHSWDQSAEPTKAPTRSSRFSGRESSRRKSSSNEAVAGNNSDNRVSIAWAELSTGVFHLMTLGAHELIDELARINPSELLYVETADSQRPKRVETLVSALGCAVTSRPDWQFRLDEAKSTLCRQFRVSTLSGFGLSDDDPAVGAASAVVHYLLETQRGAPGSAPGSAPGNAPGNTPASASGHAEDHALPHLQPPKRFDRADHLVIDQTSLRSLEIERTTRSGDTAGSLLGVLQDCRTAMGKRRLRQWLCYPLAKREAIEQRQRAVTAMIEDARLLTDLRGAFDQVQDVQRIISRVAVGRAGPRDLAALGRSSAQAKQMIELLADRPALTSYVELLAPQAERLSALACEIDGACVDSPPGHLREGGLIRDGYDEQLDEYRRLQNDSSAWLAAYQKQLIEQTGVANLKIGYNKVFGYYIELTAAQRDKASDDWTRKQTLKNAERYITPPLKQYEAKALSSRERAVAREQALFAQLCQRVYDHLEALHVLADVVAQLDVLACFARRAVRYHYTAPTIVEEPILHIQAGRHPVLDELLGDRFVPNDVLLGAADKQQNTGSLALITGPNMAGKSTYIRQTALMVLLAHTGSFIPAEFAVIGLCDRIFTRIGASDELHAGHSTFMVEMTETANICHHATPRSLVILDEIGRGTSTLDGLALAWAIAEHLAKKHCRTLFATHYHELIDLADQYPQIVNLNVTVREWRGDIVFLHRIAPGSADKSYGIHVARIAGLPGAVVKRADQLLAQLEVSHHQTDCRKAPASDSQGSLFTEYLAHPVVEQLSQTKLEQLTPMQAFDLVRQWREQAAE